MSRFHTKGAHFVMWGRKKDEIITLDLSSKWAIINEPVVAININRQYPRAKDNAKDLYEATRSMWRLNRDRANRARYAFAVYKGEIKEVYEIERWLPATEDTRRYWRESALTR